MNKEFINEVQREYQRLLRYAFGDEVRAECRLRYKKNPEPKLRWRRNNPDKCKEACLRWRQIHREKYLLRKRELRKANCKKLSEQSHKYVMARQKTDLNFRMRYVLRSRIHTALNGKTKAGLTFDLLGCSVENFWI